MTQIAVIGIGPGSPELLTEEANRALSEVTDVFGYSAYLSRLSGLDGVTFHVSDNREEVARARAAVEMALSGRKVAVVSGGDAGVFGMSSALFEALETGPAAWREIDVKIVPGVSAVLAVAARLGAPLGGDFVVMSLSDNLKPWSVIENRLRAAAMGGFVMALFNPRSKARPDQLSKAIDLLRQHLSPETETAFVRAATRPDEKIILGTLASCNPDDADMATLVLIGAPTTRRLERSDGRAWLYTLRSVPGL